jgi:hypothetical protein
MGTQDRRSQWCNRLRINDPVVGFSLAKESEKRSDTGEEILAGAALNVIRAGCYSGPGLCPIWDIP